MFHIGLAQDIESKSQAKWGTGAAKGDEESEDDGDGGIGSLADVRLDAARHTPSAPSSVRKKGKKRAGSNKMNLRVEARDTGAGFKIKTRYLYDYNMLESTFLCCAIFVLLAGMMFKSSEFDGVAYSIMEWFVLSIVFGSTVACIVTVLAELFASLKYYHIAKKVGGVGWVGSCALLQACSPLLNI